MKLKIIWLGLMLVVGNLTYGQTVSKENYAKAVDYVNCKTIDLSLKEFSPVYHNNYSKEVNCKSKNVFEAISKFLNEIKDIKKTIDLSNEINNLKTDNSFKEKWQITDATEFLSEGIFQNPQYKALSAFAASRKDNQAFTSLKADLGNNLISILSGKEEKPDSAGDSPNVVAIPAQTKTIAEESDSYSFPWVFFILGVLVIVTFAYLLWKVTDLKAKLRKADAEYLELSENLRKEAGSLSKDKSYKEGYVIV